MSRRRTLFEEMRFGRCLSLAGSVLELFEGAPECFKKEFGNRSQEPALVDTGGADGAPRGTKWGLRSCQAP